MSDIVHLSYAHVEGKYTSPESWLSRVAFISGIPEKLLPFGSQTVIYNIGYKGEIHRNGVRYLFPGFKGLQLRLPFAYNRLIRKLKPDVVLIHGLRSAWQLIMLRWTIGPRVKIICQHHADRPFDDFRKYIFRWADKYVDAYLFASRVQGEEWVKDRIYVVMGMSSIFYPEHRPKTGKVYLWVGDLDHNKDPLTAVKAFVKYSEKYPDVELNMIYQNDELLDELKSIANKNIHFIGMVEHAKLQDWFNRSDFIISTSYYESAGIAVCEAMSCGCIPILTYIPSFAMMTGEWSVGRWFIPGDVDMLQDALEEPFDKDESQRVIDHFEKELSFEANARKIVEVINQL